MQLDMYVYLVVSTKIKFSHLICFYHCRQAAFIGILVKVCLAIVDTKWRNIILNIIGLRRNSPRSRVGGRLKTVVAY